MKKIETTKIETVLKGLFDLNDFNGNKGNLKYLDTIFLGFIASLECEEMECRERSNITFYYMKLRQVIINTNEIYEKDIIDFKNQA